MIENNQMVWVVIPTWNRRDDLLACLESLDQVTDTPIQIVVVDNASTDGSADAVETHFPPVHVIRLKENIGAPAASNIGFEYALEHSAKYILRLDSDTVVAPDFLTPLVAALKQDPQIAVVSPKIYFFDPPDTIWYAGVDAHPWHFGAIDPFQQKKDASENSQMRQVDYVWGAAMLMERDVLEKTHGFDTDFFIYYEEIDFCKRVSDLSYQIYLVPDSKVWHKVGTQNPTAWRAYEWNRSKILLFRKHAKNSLHRLLLILYAFSYAFITAVVNLFHLRKYNTNRGPFRHALKGLWDGLRHPLSTNGEHHDGA